MTTFSEILNTVTDKRQISVDDILSPRRTRRVAHARQEIAYLTRKLTPMSYAEIGGRIDRDHTTVLHSIEAVGARMKDPRYCEEIDDMRVSVQPQFIRHGAIIFKSRRLEMSIMQNIELGSVRPLASLRMPSVREPEEGLGVPPRKDSTIGDGFDAQREDIGEEALGQEMRKISGGGKLPPASGQRPIAAKVEKVDAFAEACDRIEAALVGWMTGTQMTDALGLSSARTFAALDALYMQGRVERDRWRGSYRFRRVRDNLTNSGTVTLPRAPWEAN